MDIIFSSLPIDKINKDKTLDLQEIQQIYNFLLTNDYYIFSDYALVNKLFQIMVLNNRWDSKIALRYFEYLCFLSWEYEAIIVRDLLLDNHVSLAGEFCLDTELVKDGLSYLEMMPFGGGKIMIVTLFRHVCLNGPFTMMKKNKGFIK